MRKFNVQNVIPDAESGIFFSQINEANYRKVIVLDGNGMPYGNIYRQPVKIIGRNEFSEMKEQHYSLNYFDELDAEPPKQFNSVQDLLEHYNESHYFVLINFSI